MQVLLRKLAPSTPKDKRERFIPFLEQLMPEYQITEKEDVCAFLATICFESNYFRRTAEMRIVNPKNPEQERAKRYQDKYWSTGYYGRGLIQLTHKANYEAFNLAMRAKYGERAPDFVRVPVLVAEAQWAVESACWYWKKHRLNGRTFFETQGLVNRGDAKKRALDYEDREKLYFKALPSFPSVTSSKPSSDNSTQPSSSVDPIESSQPAGSSKEVTEGIFNRSMSKLAEIKGKFDAIGVDPASISKPSWIKIAIQYVLAAIFGAYAFLKDNPLVLVGMIAFIGFAVYLYSRSKDRADRRRA